MAMGALRFRFETRPTEAALRERLRAEIGRRRASGWNVELDWPSADSLMVLSQDGIALVYARKVCAELGGVAIDLSTGELQHPAPLPEWVQTPWIALPWWRRFRLWLGPTQL